MFAAVLFASRGRAVAAVAAEQPALAAFLLGLYGVTYILAVAFYKPISGTTLRMLLNARAAVAVRVVAGVRAPAR